MAAIYRILNRIFGRTQFFILILGWFFIITGMLMFWQPEAARRRISRKGFRLVKAYLTALVLCLCAFFVSVTSRMSGLASLAVLIAAIVILLKGSMFLRKAAAERISDWVGKVPVKYLRLYAAIQIVMGIGMLILRQRMPGY